MAASAEKALSMAWITIGFPPEVSGVAIGNAERARWLAARDDVRLTVCAPDTAPGSTPPVIPGVNVVRYAAKTFLPYRLVRVPRRRAIAEINHALEEFGPDVVIITDIERAFFLGSWAVPGRAYARRRNIPFVAHYHTDYLNFVRCYPLYRPFRRVLFRPVMVNLYRRTDAAVCATENAARALDSLNATPVNYVPFIGVDTSIFTPERRDRAVLQRMIAGYDGCGKVLLYLGRLGREKRVELVIKAFRELVTSGRHQDLTLVIAGDGPANITRELRALASFSDRVHFLGFVNGDNRADLYASCDVFCTASKYETFGRTVVEAMASGIVVVASENGAITDYLSDQQNSILFKGNYLSAAAAIDCALKNDNSTVIENAKKTASGFSVEAGCLQLLEFYENLLSNSPSVNIRR
jgi:phosphatidylinositol alpha 1,6-mannosyltransferase